MTSISCSWRSDKRRIISIDVMKRRLKKCRTLNWLMCLTKKRRRIWVTSCWSHPRRLDYSVRIRRVRWLRPVVSPKLRSSSMCTTTTTTNSRIWESRASNSSSVSKRHRLPVALIAFCSHRFRRIQLGRISNFRLTSCRRTYHNRSCRQYSSRVSGPNR